MDINRTGWAKNLAGFALAAIEIGTVWRVEHRVLGNCLREGGVDGFALGETSLKYLIDDLARAFLFAYTTSGAEFFNHIAGFLADCDIKIAHITRDILNLAPAVQGDVGMLIHIHHFGRQDTG